MKRRVPDCTHDGPIFFIGHMLVSLNISETLAESKVHEMNNMRLLL